MKFKQVFLNVVVALSLVAPVAVFAGTASAASPAPSAPSTCGNDNTPKGEVLQGVGETASDCSDAPVNNIFQTAVQILSILIGVASTIMVLYAGFRYITSGGESGRVSNAKATLMYALIGLAVAGLAQLMIHFVLFQTNNVTGTPQPAKKSTELKEAKITAISLIHT